MHQIIREYTKFLYDFPFSRAAPLFRAVGESVDPKYGGNCFDQVREMRTRGIISKVVKDLSSGHTGGVLDNLFFDPSWGVGPVEMKGNFTALARSNHKFRYAKEETTLTATRVNGTENYIFDLTTDAKLPGDVEYAALAKWAASEAVWISTYDEKGQDPITLWFTDGYSITRNMRTPKEVAVSEGDQGFEENLEIIAARLGEDPNTLKQFLKEADSKKELIKVV